MDNQEEVVLEEDEKLDDDEVFLNNLNSTLFVKKDYDMKDFDYEWLDILEDVLPYIDNIFHYLNYLILFVLLLMYLFYQYILVYHS